jgi:E3 ubiquitin-protein ligase UBR1
MVDDACFEPVLKEVANFKPPESTTDTGVYELKNDAFGEVNPFFYHYTRNKREEVEVILRNRLKKQTSDPHPVIVPKPLDIDSGPFSTLALCFESKALLQVIFYAIFNVLVLTDSDGTPPPSGEAILDQSLHLVMLALVGRRSEFCRLAGVTFFE